jgi:hypothetical protein
MSHDVEHGNAEPIVDSAEPTLADQPENEKGAKRKPGETWKAKEVHEIPKKYVVTLSSDRY